MQYQLIRSNRKSIAISFERDGNFKKNRVRETETASETESLTLEDEGLTLEEESLGQPGYEGLRLVVKAPYWVSPGEIASFVASKREWILATAKRLEREQRKAMAGRPRLENGDTLDYLGEKRTLSVIREERSRARVKCVMDRLLLWVPYEADYEYKRAQLEKWYRREALQIFTRKAEEYALILQVGFHEIHIKDQKSRWGSCSGRKNLNFNWRLIMAPEPVCDYVIIHELCHLRFMDHSAAFWGLVESLCPGYKQYRNWLKENGGRLYVI